MAEVDKLENMSNSELREQCKLFGLPNIPVTDTSRKILIRKLRFAIEGQVNGEKDKKKRRETIHNIAIKTSADETELAREPKTVRSASARKTMIASSSIDSPATSRRRSSRHSTSSETVIPSFDKKSVDFQKRKTAILLEEEEEDSEDDLLLVEAVETAEKIQRTKATSSQVSKDRRSRSVSLSLQKSPTVTTSYKKDIPLTVHETEEESENEALTQKVYNYNTTKPFVPSQSERQSYYKPPLVPFNSTSSNRYTTVGNIPSNQSVITALEKSSLSRRSTFYKYDTQDESFNKEINIGSEAHTPYYSDFAKRLERLKNEKLSMKDASYKRDRTGTERQNANEQNMNGFSEFLLNVDQKYNIKQKLIIILAVFFLLTAYIFLFH